jgi:galactose oxidase-like protein
MLRNNRPANSGDQGTAELMEDGMKSRILILVAMVLASLSFSACGKSGESTKVPSSTTYTIGGTVSGLPADAMGFRGLELQNNGADTLVISGNGSFTFATLVASGGAYAVTVLSQPHNPVTSTCVVTNGSGTAGANVTSVQVACTTNAYTIGGTVSGLSGSGLVLQDNAGDNLPVGANGSFTFATSIASGGAYSVTVLTQPTNPAQTCVVASGSGTATKANVTNVQVACATVSTTYTIGGTVSGLSGSGLVLQDNGGDNLPVSANGSFTFATPIASGANYNVTVLTQPSNPVQTCGVTNGSGAATANVTSILVACSTTTTTYTIGGTLSGLNGTDVVLQDNGGNNLTVTANGSFTFSTPIASGSAYSVTVLTQPSNPTQTCTVTDGSGTANANVTSVQVACVDGIHNQWIWVSGANVINQPGSYGTEGLSSPSNVPPGQSQGVGWRDTSGNFWIYDVTFLWRYSQSEWTWMDGSSSTTWGIYGTLGTPSASNAPGSRQGASGWTDASGNLWLFGGTGLGSDNGDDSGVLNDLWEYNTNTGYWTWMAGSDLANAPGTYGTQGTPAPSNTPGARYFSTSTTDASGNFCLFGGLGQDANGMNGTLSDLWEYSAGEWTWVSGSNLAGQWPVYGTKGTPDPSNFPGARQWPATWIDASGNFWLFGGLGPDGGGGAFNDLWEYNVTSKEWTWISGSNTTAQPGIYGTEGAAAPANVPGAREYGASWTDANGNLWLFGGFGYDSVGTYNILNDLWKFTPSTGEWTWVSGANTADQQGTYGALGSVNSTNVPGARQWPVAWTDASGNFWLFGGMGYGKTGSSYGALNDLWEYNP